MENGRRRIILLDEVRGLCVALMVFYHLFYVLGDAFELGFMHTSQKFFEPLQPFFASVFIFISGISSRLSRSNLKRGAKLMCVALGFTAVTVLVLPLLGFSGNEIFFGILHLLASCMLIFALIKPLTDKIPPAVGFAVCTVLFFVTFAVPSGFLGLSKSLGVALPDSLYTFMPAAVLGFPPDSFHSADYFPLIPNLFVFLAGTFFGVYAARGQLPESFYKGRVPFLSWTGRHALIIYVLHWPIIFVLGLIIS